MARATRADVARLAGVSVATVSHVMNGRAEELGFSPATAARVKATAAELGYVPKASARALRYQGAPVIGVFLGEIPASLHLPIFNEMLLAAIEEAAARGAYVVPILCPERDRQAALNRARKTLGNIDLAGAICEAVPHMHGAGDLLIGADVPVAWVNPRGRDAPGSGVGSCVIDEGAGVSDAMRQLRLPSSSRLVALQGPGVTPDRIRALEPFGHVEIVRASEWLAEAGESALTQYLRQRHNDYPDVVFAANDHLAMGAVVAVRRLGVDVPDDMQVIGYGDYDQAASRLIQLSTVHWPLAEMMAHAVRVVIEAKNHRGVPATKVFATAARMRGTTRC